MPSYSTPAAEISTQLLVQYRPDTNMPLQVPFNSTKTLYEIEGHSTGDVITIDADATYTLTFNDLALLILEELTGAGVKIRFVEDGALHHVSMFSAVAPSLTKIAVPEGTWVLVNDGVSQVRVRRLSVETVPA